MRGFNLKYGFVSTYGTTVFVRRTQDFRFELSEPIDHRSERPTLRECFLVFLRLAAQGPEYHEDENFIERQVRVMSASCLCGWRSYLTIAVELR